MVLSISKPENQVNYHHFVVLDCRDLNELGSSLDLEVLKNLIEMVSTYVRSYIVCIIYADSATQENSPSESRCCLSPL